MAIEQQAAEALLDVGVSVPFKQLHLPFVKRGFTLSLTMRRPYLGTQIRIAREYLKMGITHEEISAMAEDDSKAFIARHGQAISLMVALCVCRGYLPGRLLARPLAWVLRHFVEDIYLSAAYTHFVALLGTASFTPIIVSAEASNPLRPMTSHETKRG